MSDLIREIRYVLGLSQTSFEVPFQLFELSDMDVSIVTGDGEEIVIPADQFSYSSVSKTVTISDGLLAAGSVLSIKSTINGPRPYVFTQQQSLNSDNLNLDFDRLSAGHQEIRRDFQARALLEKGDRGDDGDTLDLTNVVAKGADNTGVSPASAVIKALLDAGQSVFLPKGTYLIDPGALVISQPGQRIVGAPGRGTVIKLHNPVPGLTSDIIRVMPTAIGAGLVDLVLDGQKDALLSSYTQSSTKNNGWRGIFGDAPFAVYKNIHGVNFINSPFWAYGDFITVDNVTADACCSGIYIGEISGVGPNSYKGLKIDGVHVTNMDTDLTGQPGASKVMPHAIDLYNLDFSNIRNVTVKEQNGRAEHMMSPQISGITVAGCRFSIFNGLAVKDMLYGEGQHAVVTLPYNSDCLFFGIIAENFNGVGIEPVGCIDCVIDNFIVDGLHNCVGANTRTNGYGITGGQRTTHWEKNLGFHWQGGRNIKFSNGIIRGVPRALSMKGGQVSLSNVKIYNTAAEGILMYKPASGQAKGNYDGTYFYNDLTLDNVQIRNCGGAAILNESGNLYTNDGCRFENNNVLNLHPAQGIVTTAAMASSDNVEIPGGSIRWTNQLGDETATGATFIDSFSFAPGTTSLVTDRYKTTPAAGDIHVFTVTLLDGYNGPSQINEGEAVILKTAKSGGADSDVGRIISMGSDGCEIAFASAQDFVANAGQLSAAQLVAAQGLPDQYGQAVLLGNGTQWVDEFKGREWITDGTEWRQILRVILDTQLIISAPFSSTPDSIQYMRVDAQAVPTTSGAAFDFGTQGTVFVGDVKYDGYAFQKKMNIAFDDVFGQGSIVYYDFTFTPNGTSTQTISPIDLPNHKLLEYRSTILETFAGGNGNLAVVYYEPVTGSFATFSSGSAAKNTKRGSTRIQYITEGETEFRDEYNGRYVVQHGSATTGSARIELKVQYADMPTLPDVA